MEQGKKRLATLVGCNYFNTPNELSGCVNDVESMKKVIVDRFGFDLADIQVLTDEPSSPVQPTGANIRLALGQMVNRAEPGDVLFFHYSGHGTLIPAVKPGHRVGSSRKKDEAIVPCDFNLITDVDFRQIVDRLPPGVSFTMISDSCHSGGLIDQEKEQIGPSTMHNPANIIPKHQPRRKMIPFDDILQHVSHLSSIQSDHVGDHLVHLFGIEASPKFTSRELILPRGKKTSKADDGILLSGCQTNETSADMGPGEDDDGEDSKPYGAFSNSIQEVLKEVKGRVSNREVVLRARALLHEQGFTQHPCLYSSDENADAPFLWRPLDG